MTTGVLLINLGTPDNPTVSSVRRYLAEFLTDPRVVDLPSVVRYLLVYGIILPFRCKKTAKAYQAIWTEQGSPLRIISQSCQRLVQQQLGSNFCVTLGMRYGNPSIASAIDHLQQKHCEKIIVLPLFPQYSSAATGSAIAKALSILQQQQNIPSVDIIHDFYNHPQYIQTYVHHIQHMSEQRNHEFYLFSYHGLPERQILKSEMTENLHCDRSQACPAITQDNRFCYRAQCYATTQLIADGLHLEKNQYQTSFQSRLGRTPWIKPYTDEILAKLYQQGIRNIAVICPSFVSDCLETLEEISLRARIQWKNLGGNQLTLIPCLNTQPSWIEALANIIREYV